MQDVEPGGCSLTIISMNMTRAGSPDGIKRTLLTSSSTWYRAFLLFSHPFRMEDSGMNWSSVGITMVASAACLFRFVAKEKEEERKARGKKKGRFTEKRLVIVHC